MKKSFALSVLVSIFVLLPGLSQAQTTVTMTCQRAPRNLKLLKRALKSRVLNLITTRDLYDRVRTNVRLVKISNDETEIQVNEDQLLENMDFLFDQEGDAPRGLEVDISGFVNTAPSQVCSYEYRAIVRSTGISRATGKREQSTTTNIITINEPLFPRRLKTTESAG